MFGFFANLSAACANPIADGTNAPTSTTTIPTRSSARRCASSSPADSVPAMTASGQIGLANRCWYIQSATITPYAVIPSASGTSSAISGRRHGALTSANTITSAKQDHAGPARVARQLERPLQSVEPGQALLLRHRRVGQQPPELRVAPHDVRAERHGERRHREQRQPEALPEQAATQQEQRRQRVRARVDQAFRPGQRGERDEHAGPQRDLRRQQLVALDRDEQRHAPA